MTTEKPKPPTVAELLQQRKFDPNKSPAPEQIIFRIGGKKVGSLQNLVTFTGKQKNGKTRYIAATIAAGLTGNSIFQIQLRTPAHRHKIALFDTEQGEYDFYRLVAQIKDFTGLNELPATFDAFNTREDDPLTILKLIYEYLKQTPDCSVLVIDGLLDLVLDFNNVTESKKVTNYIKKITKQFNCLVIAVLHRGKGTDTTIGNIGSMADRLAQSVLKVEKNKERGTFVLSSDFMRSDEDFTPIEIWKTGNVWEETFHMPETETNPAPVRPLKPRPQDYEYQHHFERLQEIFTDGALLLDYEQLIKEIKEIYGVGRNWAVDCIKHLKSENLIYKTPDGYTTQAQKRMFK